MKKFLMIVGAIISLFGLSIMFTPLRTYFILGWITGCVLICTGGSLLLTGLKRRNRSLGLCLMGTVTLVVGLVILGSDLQQSMPETVIVHLVAGGILISGLVECILGYFLMKRGEKALVNFLGGLGSFALGLGGLLFQDMAVIVIGVVVGYHITRMGLQIFFWGKNLDKPQVIDL